MTRKKILTAAAVWLIILIAAGATFREALPVAPQPSVAAPQPSAAAPQPSAAAPQPSAEIDFDERWISIEKGDRLPLLTPTPYAVAAAQSEVTPPVASPPEQLPLATEDDIKQAEAEHHRHSDICRHGRTYFTIQHHEYWRCK
jgi:hypothetical protein